MSSTSTIVYTKTDEAPALATHSLLPILRAFTAGTGIDFELKDISLAGRILSHFPDVLEPDQRVPDALSELGELATRPEANIIKLPNVSASVPQLQDAIKELQDKGFPVPDFPTDPQTEEERSGSGHLRKSLGIRRKPRPEGGELGSPRRQTGQGIRPKESPPHGCLVERIKVPRRAHEFRRLLRKRKIHRDPQRHNRSISNSSILPGKAEF